MVNRNWRLMDPVRVGTVQLRNRIVMPPMETLYNNADGSVSQELIDYYAERAHGGVGLIVVQNSFIDTSASRSAYCMLSIATGHMIAGLSRLAEAIHLGGARAVIQLGHGGRQCNPDALPPGVQHVAPSPVPCFVWGVTPRELTVGEIREIQDSFARAAVRAQKAGLDGVELHSAHGYLMGQFISPLSNQRKDEYGGTLENRSRFALETIHRVREKVGPDFLVGFRMSGDEFLPGGLGVEEGARYAGIIADTGKIDYISVSAGTYESITSIYPVMYVERGCLIHLAEAVKKQARGVPVVAVGALDAETGERALREGKADLVAIGRGLLADPEMPNKIAAGRLEDIRPCIRCNEGCFTRIASGRPVKCAVNPACGREKAFRLTPAGKKKKVMVIGGGVAGLEAARTAALRGHLVTLVEKGDIMGGHLVSASASPFKKPLKELLDWALKQVEKSGVRLLTGTLATPDLVRREGPDALVVAVGSEWDRSFAGGNVYSGREVLAGECNLGEKVVVIGGGATGCELALDIAVIHKKKVTVVEMQNQAMAGMEILNMLVLMQMLAGAGVEILTGLKVKEIAGGVVHCVGAGGERRDFEADTVVLCTGLKANRELADSFRGLAPEVYVIGDCVVPRKIFHAFEEAHRAVLKI